MPFPTQFNDAVFRHLDKLRTQVVAESGIPSDRFHIGKIIIQSLKDAPDFVLQIDGATGQSETCGSVLRRSIKCASSLKNYGFTIGDVIMVSAPNHLDLAVPVYAAQYNGQIVCPVWTEDTNDTIKCVFTAGKPKLIVCQTKQLKHIQDVTKKLQQDPLILTFDEGPNSFGKFCEEFGSNSVSEFRAADFDPTETLSFLMRTSGTTGHNKCVALTHSNIMSHLPYRLAKFDTFSRPSHSLLVLNQLYYFSCQTMFLYTAIFRIRRIQTSAVSTIDHLHELIRKFKTAVPKAHVLMNYGMTEAGSICSGICEIGKPLSLHLCGHLYAKLVDQDSGEDITERNTVGEMLLKGPSIFKAYYNNEEETDQAFSKDGWFKTGDLFYRDENYNYFFVGRIRLTIYYRSKQVRPVEIEDVISQHPGVMQVAVIGVPDAVDDELPMACVVNVTAGDIKNIVKDSLPDFNLLRGGVVFMSSLPLTPSLKTNYKKLKDMALSFIKE